MNCIIYVRHNDEKSLYAQFNRCAEYAKRNGYSVSGKVLDFQGNEFYKAVDKAIFDDDVSCLIVYDRNSIGDYDTALFYQIYLNKFDVKLISVE